MVWLVDEVWGVEQVDEVYGWGLDEMDEVQGFG